MKLSASKQVGNRGRLMLKCILFGYMDFLRIWMCVINQYKSLSGNEVSYKLCISFGACTCA